MTLNVKAYSEIIKEKAITRAIDYALEKDIPYLGICAGMQLMANTENIKNDTNHFQDHYIKILENTLLSEIIGEKEILVNSRHNYHIENSGENLVCAVSNDGIIEAIEYPADYFNIGVQWHPEISYEFDENSKKIIDAFIDASRDRLNERDIKTEVV